MFFKQDNSKAQEGFSLLPAGDYEVFAQKHRIGQAESGTPFTEFTFVVRNDVEQEGKGRKLFHTFYHTENTIGIVAGFNKAIGVPDGTDFETQQQWADYIIAKPVKARVDEEEYESKGKKGKKNVVKFFNPSDVNGTVPAADVQDKPASSFNNGKDPFANDGTPIDISDDDLPF